MDETHGGQRIVNPGSPTDKRRQPHGTVATLTLESGRVAGVEILDVT